MKIEKLIQLKSIAVKDLIKNGFIKKDAKKILEFVIIDSIKKNRWAGVYHFYAASNALKINIQPIFPTVDYGKATMSDANKFLNNLILCDGTSQGM